MIPKLEILTRIIDAGLVAIVRTETAERALSIAEAIQAGGCPAVEVTFTVPGAQQVIEALARRYKPSELILGALPSRIQVCPLITTFVSSALVDG